MNKFFILIISAMVSISAISQELKVGEKKPDVNVQEINEASLNALLVFNLKRSGLDDSSGLESEVVDIAVQSEDKDGIKSSKKIMHAVKKLKISNKSAIQLYQIAYNNIPIDHFIYPESIKWIASSTPKNLFSLDYSISKLTPYSNLELQKKLDLGFNLHSTLLELDTIELVLDRITPIDSTIKIIQELAGTYKYKSITSYSNSSINFESEYGTEQDLANVLKAKFGISVVCNKTGNDIKYQFKLNIINQNKELDSWLECLKAQGIVLEKKTKKDTYVNIEQN